MENAESVIDDACAFVFSLLPDEYKKPTVGVICGTGLSNLGSRLTNVVDIPFSSIPHFPQTAVVGHGKSLLVGVMNGVVTMVLTGRIHSYEGHQLFDVVLPVRILVRIGITALLVTNAAGALDPTFGVGDIMVIEDHISFLNLAGMNPLRGPNIDSFGPRFPSMTHAYNPKSFELVHKAATESAMELTAIRRGVYVMVGGPSYETNAEVRFLHLIGGSAVGMSTAPEVTCAAHAKVHVIGLSLITNATAAAKVTSSVSTDVEPNHSDILEIGKKRSADMESLVFNLMPKLAGLI